MAAEGEVVSEYLMEGLRGEGAVEEEEVVRAGTEWTAEEEEGGLLVSEAAWGADTPSCNAVASGSADWPYHRDQLPPAPQPPLPLPNLSALSPFFNVSFD